MPSAINSVLHIGAPKCGSSSLQTHLSMNPNFKSRTGQSYSYVTINGNAHLEQGDAITQQARLSNFGYAATADLAPKSSFPDTFPKAKSSLRKLIRGGSIPILSSEGWAQRAELFRERGYLQDMGLAPHVVLFIRPPLDWINSAWWQWGVWSTAPMERWVRRNIEFVRWDRVVDSWLAVPGVEKLSVRLATSNVVDQFFDLLDAKTSHAEQRNVSVSPELLHFLLRNREYREGPHDPQVEFILSRWVNFSDTKSPWVIPSELQKTVMDEVTAGYKALLPHLQPDQREEVENDPRWWDVSTYADRKISAPQDFEKPERMDILVKDLIDALIEIDSDERARAMGF